MRRVAAANCRGEGCERRSALTPALAAAGRPSVSSPPPAPTPLACIGRPMGLLLGRVSSNWAAPRPLTSLDSLGCKFTPFRLFSSNGCCCNSRMEEAPRPRRAGLLASWRMRAERNWRVMISRLHIRLATGTSASCARLRTDAAQRRQRTLFLDLRCGLSHRKIVECSNEIIRKRVSAAMATASYAATGCCCCCRCAAAAAASAGTSSTIL